SFVLSSAKCHGLESNLSCVLNSKMSQPADAVHRHNVATARTRIAERVVNGDARAHEWSCFFRRQLIRNQRHRRHRRDHVLSISAIEIDTGDFAIYAHGEIAAPALFADKTMPAVPAYADALTFLP